MPEIQNHCKNAAVIREGKLIKAATVDELTKTSAKVITLSNIESLNMLQDENLTCHIANVEKVSNGIRLLYKGDIRKLIYQLQSEEFSDITITEPSLDEIFMHFYK